MREDMKRIIIDTGRYVYAWLEGRTAGTRSRERQHLRRDPDLLPEVEGMRRRVLGGSRWSSDRTAPLGRALEKQVGRSWDEVWSEICRANDARSMDGWHLRQHVSDWVELASDPPQLPVRGVKPLLVDEEGVLRRNPEYRHNAWRRMFR